MFFMFSSSESKYSRTIYIVGVKSLRLGRILPFRFTKHNYLQAYKLKLYYKLINGSSQSASNKTTLRAKLPMLNHDSQKDYFTQHCSNRRLDGMWGALWNNLTTCNSFQLQNIFVHLISTPWKYSVLLMPLEKTNASYKT